METPSTLPIPLTALIPMRVVLVWPVPLSDVVWGLSLTVCSSCACQRHIVNSTWTIVHALQTEEPDSQEEIADCVEE